jgi:rubrerythrin
LPKIGTIDKENPPAYIKIKEVLVFVCQSCGHEWMPRNEKWAPYKCPLCQALDWKGEEEASHDETDENLGGFAGNVRTGR